MIADKDFCFAELLRDRPVEWRAVGTHGHTARCNAIEMQKTSSFYCVRCERGQVIPDLSCQNVAMSSSGAPHTHTEKNGGALGQKYLKHMFAVFYVFLKSLFSDEPT